MAEMASYYVVAGNKNYLRFLRNTNSSFYENVHAHVRIACSGHVAWDQ